MATVNLNNVPFDPSLREPAADNANVGNNVAVDAPTVQSAFFPTTINPTETSAFDGVKSGSGSNVLSTPPPALGGGQTSPVHYAEAMGRMSTLQNNRPFTAALTRSAEDGTAPAVSAPKAFVGASISGTAAVSMPAQIEADANSASSPSLSGSGQTIDLNSRNNNTDVNGASDDLQTEAANIQKSAGEGHEKKCKKGTSHDGEFKLQDRLQDMGMTKKRSEVLARFLNDNNVGAGSNHNAQDESTVALSIAAYDKLNTAGSKEAAGQVLDQLNTLADNFYDSVKTTKASDAYYQSMNVLGGYVMQASANTAITSLSSSSATSPVRIVPYPTVVD